MTAHRLFTTKTGQFVLFKYMVYSLLAFNVYLYAKSGTFTETIDTAAWVVILGLFEWETLSIRQEHWGKIEKGVISLLSLFGYSVVLYSGYSYFIEKEWLDFVNSVTWILVILVLQYDIYFPGHYGQSEWTARNIIKFALYAALFVFAVLWGIQGEALDFYDAFLWILSFFVIEMNIFNFEHRLVEESHKGEQSPLYRPLIICDTSPA
jgi:hypothetical protein